MKSHLPEDTKVKANGNLQMNLYDLNKQFISQMPALDLEQLEQGYTLINQLISNTSNAFYMLLCRDMNYYTLFNLVDSDNEPTIADEVLACATDIGVIKSIELVNGDTAIEIWVHPIAKGVEPAVMYLFPYDAGVIKCTL